MKKALAATFLLSALLLGNTGTSVSASSLYPPDVKKTVHGNYCTITAGNDDSVAWNIYWPNGSQSLGPALYTWRTFDANRYPRIKIQAIRHGMTSRITIANESCLAQL
jgi:hypothetical protein